jgi:hypothetical protein
MKYFDNVRRGSVAYIEANCEPVAEHIKASALCLDRLEAAIALYPANHQYLPPETRDNLRSRIRRRRREMEIILPDTAEKAKVAAELVDQQLAKRLAEADAASVDILTSLTIRLYSEDDYTPLLQQINEARQKLRRAAERLKELMI